MKKALIAFAAALGAVLAAVTGDLITDYLHPEAAQCARPLEVKV